MLLAWDRPVSDIGPIQRLTSYLYSPSAADWLACNSHTFIYMIIIVIADIIIQQTGMYPAKL
jgi:hypothetical protein